MHLWHLDPGDPHPPIPGELGEDLATHLRYASLSTAVAQVGGRQQAYLCGAGCAGCSGHRCEAGCRMALLRRVLGAHGVMRQLRRVPAGLAERPYRRVALAIPGRRALPLASELLRPWGEARLWVTWRQLGRWRWAGAALAVGDGDDPAVALRAAGWLALTLPAWRALCAAPLPATLPYGGQWAGPPFLLLPSVAPHGLRHPSVAARPDPTQGLLTSRLVRETEVGSRRPEADSALLARAIARLDLVGGADPLHDRAENQLLGDSIWPDGPDGLTAAEVGELAALLAAPELREGRPGQIGLGVDRVRRLTGRSRGQVAALLCWLDLAGALESARDPQVPWRDARPLAIDDLELFAARLRATPHPTAADIGAAFPKRGAAQ